MKNSDRKFQLLSAVLITLFCCILLINSNYVLVESQTSPTFLTLTGSTFLDIENSERLQLKDFTLSTWFRTDKQDYLEPGTIVNKGGMNDDAPGNNMNYGIWITPEEFLEGGFETQRGTNIFVTSKQKFNDGNWHNAILTNDGLFLKLYVDGVEIGKISTLGAIPDMKGSQSIRLGANALNLDKFFTGDIDEVILWDRALSLEEIFNVYNYDEFPSNGRILYLPFSSISPIQSSYKYQPFKTFEQTEKDVIEKEESFRLSNFSLGTWFRIDRIDHNGPMILLNKGGFGGERPGENLNFGIWLNPSETIEGGFETKPGTNVFVSSQEKYNDGLWHYVLLTYDNKILKLYIDGVLADSKITSGATPDNSGDQDFVIGGNSFMDDKFFKGDLDEIRVWNRALSTDEVSNGFNNNTFNTHGQIFYEPYSDLDTQTPPPPTETPDTQTPPPPTETPDTQTPPLDSNATGFLLLKTNVINDNNGTKQASNFTINMKGSQASPSSFKAVQSPLAQLIEIVQGEYSVQVGGIEGYDAKFKNDCSAFAIENNITVCTITLNDLLITPPSQCPPGQSLTASQHLNQTTQQCVPDPQPPPSKSVSGFLLLRTDVINDNGGTKQAPDFTINILGSQASPSTLKAAQSPLAQVIAIEQGQYFVQVVGIEGYDAKFKNECAGFMIQNNTKVCTITLNDLSTPPPTETPDTQPPPTETPDTQPPPTETPDTQPPTGDEFVPFNFAAAGDWGCNSNTEKNVKSMLSKEPELVLGLGDYSYEKNANCWLKSISPVNDRMKISIGNHDSDEEEGPEITVQLLDHFKLNKQYYSFSKGNVFFLVMSTQDSYSKNSEQFNFVKQELEKASKDPNIDWIVVYYHKPIYTSSTKHAGLTSFRDIYHPLFDQYKVDLVLAGHNHNYQRTFPLSFNQDKSAIPIIVSKNPNTYNEIGAPIFIISGTGGVGLHSLGSQAEFTAKQFGKFGHINIDVSKDVSNKLMGTFYDLTGNKLDEFTITKTLASTPTPQSSSSSSTTTSSTQSLSATSTPLTTTDNSDVDVFGIKKIYPTKPGGEEWFMNMDNMKSDPRFEISGSGYDIKKNSDSSWSPVSNDKVRLLVYTSDSKGKFDGKNMSTYNLKELAARGHWYKANDWKNIEMGGYFKLNNADDERSGYSFYSRSIDHSSTHGGCGGATPKFNIGFDGEIKAKKEMWHLSLLDSPGVNDEDLSPSIVGKWLGIKGIIYNLPGDKGVKQEFWIDKTNEGKWEKVYEFTDQGGFGERGNNGPEKCGGNWDQLYTWASPKSVFTWDQSDVSFKDLSVREILPPTP
ncbi:MAG TPA: LamG-like jellyroll fold domain-containing protein [Nitrososphaeraceae archaeon]|nr:LamG-like jellyroll fold domain-containing protein [Nitrososphaeraceae archaeon]